MTAFNLKFNLVYVLDWRKRPNEYNSFNTKTLIGLRISISNHFCQRSNEKKITS